MDWAEVNPDILRLISMKLGDISNVIRFRIVCKNWHLAIGPCNHPPQLPWFALYDPIYEGPFGLEFFSLYSNRIHSLNTPQVTLEQSNRYLLTGNFTTRPPSLFNPLNGSRFPIPQIANFAPLYPIYIGPARQSENGDIAIALMDPEKQKGISVAFFRFDDRQLVKIIEVPYAISIIYLRGRLFVSAMGTRETRVFDVASGDEVMVISQSGVRFDYFIEDCGDLLGVVDVPLYMDGEPFWECQFEVYRLVDSDTNPHWVKMNDGIGDRMLFLDQHGGFCLKASDFDGFVGNCIYFMRSTADKFNLCRYDLMSKEIRALIRCGEFFYGIWSLPSMY